jgi:hypothetical protein
MFFSRAAINAPFLIPPTALSPSTMTLPADRSNNWKQSCCKHDLPSGLLAPQDEIYYGTVRNSNVPMIFWIHCACFTSRSSDQITWRTRLDGRWYTQLFVVWTSNALPHSEKKLGNLNTLLQNVKDALSKTLGSLTYATPILFLG